MLTRTQEELYLPARDMHLTTLEDILDATIEKVSLIRRNSPAAQRITEEMPPGGAAKLNEVFELMEKEHGKLLGGITLLDLIEQTDNNPDAAPQEA